MIASLIDCLSLHGDLLSWRFAGDFFLKAAFIPSHLICYRIIVDPIKPVVPNENDSMFRPRNKQLPHLMRIPIDTICIKEADFLTK